MSAVCQTLSWIKGKKYILYTCIQRYLYTEIFTKRRKIQEKMVIVIRIINEYCTIGNEQNSIGIGREEGLVKFGKFYRGDGYLC